MARKSVLGTGLVALTILVSGCRSGAPRVAAMEEPPLPEPVVPGGYEKIAPSAVDTAAQMLAQTATVFTGRLSAVRFTYEECAGPRTSYVFSDSSALVGARVPAELTVKVFGGPTPRGTWVRVAELPTLALDARYVVFLRNTDWTFSPIVGNLVFRRETAGGREVLVDATGHAVTAWTDDGPRLSAAAVSEPVGTRMRGYRNAESSARTRQREPAMVDPEAEVRPAGGPAPAPAPEQTEESVLPHAPSPDEIRKAGMFAKPAISLDALGNEETISAESLIASVTAAAGRAQITIGGRLTLEPYWRCWSFTYTATPRGRARRIQ